MFARTGRQMAGFIYGLLLFVITVPLLTLRSKAIDYDGGCANSERLVVRNISVLGQDSYGRAGLSHMTISGALHHGMKEVEVWMQTFAPGSGTSIHRHACEEVFITLKGAGTLFISRNSDTGVPGQPQELRIFPNATFTIPLDVVHQVRNTRDGDDLQLLVIISRPPMKSFDYENWTTPHQKAVFKPKEWDRQGLYRPAHQLCQDTDPIDVNGLSSISRILDTNAMEGCDIL